MKRALILDDEGARHTWFASELSLHGYKVVHCWDAPRAMLALQNEGPFDLICLDHDLGEGVPSTGMEVAQWMAEHAGWAADPCTVIVHSLNFPAGQLMASKLTQHGAVHVPFYQLHSGKVKLR